MKNPPKRKSIENNFIYNNIKRNKILNKYRIYTLKTTEHYGEKLKN